MSGRVFFDTSVLIYAVSSGDSRAAIAERLLASGGHISVQVLNEFGAVARRKRRMSWPEITEAIQAMRCDLVYSEDMQDGQQIGSLTIQNPFIPT
jgi:predicted nucleic acid-binding protein